jgi:hypothetical protein
MTGVRVTSPLVVIALVSRRRRPAARILAFAGHADERP